MMKNTLYRFRRRAFQQDTILQSLGDITTDLPYLPLYQVPDTTICLFRWQIIPAYKMVAEHIATVALLLESCSCCDIATITASQKQSCGLNN